jgi:alkanesulfonate monooxygenase SsuD/methylene tetrahydromethanopterin reductase-like flavin-dependent oxidoreductase (luciferase family)
MKYGFVLPIMDARAIVDYACKAEQAGWDGFFVCESWWSADAWVCLAAAAQRTTRIRLGTLLSPLSTMRPWKLASEAATLDQLSNGRVILSVGMGATDTGFAEFGEVTDLRTRAELVDEGLDLMTALWRRRPFEHRGKHYTVDVRKRGVNSMPAPVQQPRIPIWVVAAWPRPKSMHRALRCDGLIPMVKPKGSAGRNATPDDVRAIKDWVEARREASTPFDIVIEGRTPGGDLDAAQEIIQPWVAAGATWWVESPWDLRHPKEIERLRQGPPPPQSA